MEVGCGGKREEVKDGVYKKGGIPKGKKPSRGRGKWGYYP